MNSLPLVCRPSHSLSSTIQGVYRMGSGHLSVDLGLPLYRPLETAVGRPNHFPKRGGRLLVTVWDDEVYLMLLIYQWVSYVC